MVDYRQKNTTKRQKQTKTVTICYKGVNSTKKICSDYSENQSKLTFTEKTK